jgi:hypothetical protein
MTSSQRKYTKMPPESGGCSFFINEKSPKTIIFLKKPLTRYNSEAFCEE